MISDVLEDPKVAENNDAGRNSDIDYYQHHCKRTTIDLKIAKELGRMKDHSVSAE